MNYINHLIFLFIGFLASLDAANFRVATYNVLNPVFEEKYTGINTWETRFPNIIKNIQASDCDVLCLEEIGMVNYQQIASHPEIAKNYISFYLPHYRDDLFETGRDGLAFFYKPKKAIFQQLLQSNVDARPSSRRDFYVDMRIVLPEVQPTTIRIAATHLACNEADVGYEQLTSLVNDTLKISGSAVDLLVICGDFNEGHHEVERPRYDFMNQSGFVTDGSLMSTRPDDIADTHHKGHVDWIFFKKTSQKEFQFIAVEPIGDSTASDHKLTITDINIR